MQFLEGRSPICCCFIVLLGLPFSLIAMCTGRLPDTDTLYLYALHTIYTQFSTIVLLQLFEFISLGHHRHMLSKLPLLLLQPYQPAHIVYNLGRLFISPSTKALSIEWYGITSSHRKNG